jgi:DDE superfamily endonuclease
MSSPNVSSDSSIDGDLDIKTPTQILILGLQLLGFTPKEINRKSKNRGRKQKQLFIGNFGAGPHVVAQVWEDLQKTDINDAFLPPEERSLPHLLYAFHFMKAYPTEAQRVGKWHECDRIQRDKGWSMLLKIQALKEKKIVWPSEEEIGDNIWVGSVDGTHMKTQEPSHPEVPKNPKAFSYKSNSAGLSYELVLCLWKPSIIWMSGPYLASIHDTRIFNEGGLRDRLRAQQLRVIADNGYRGSDDVISRPNSQDSKEVSKCKSRARCRQESVNAKIKTLACTNSVFRHKGEINGQSKFKICFEAAVVVTQYKMEMGDPVFDV